MLLFLASATTVSTILPTSGLASLPRPIPTQPPTSIFAPRPFFHFHKIPFYQYYQIWKSYSGDWFHCMFHHRRTGYRYTL